MMDRMVDLSRAGSSCVIYVQPILAGRSLNKRYVKHEYSVTSENDASIGATANGFGP